MNLKASKLVVGHSSEQCCLGRSTMSGKRVECTCCWAAMVRENPPCCARWCKPFPPCLETSRCPTDGQELRPEVRGHWTNSVAFVSSRPPQQVGLTVKEVWALSGNPSDVEAWHPDLMGLASSRLSELSDGQAQQVMVARAMLQSDRWLVLDEPTAFLDVRAQRRLWRMLEGHVARGGGVLMATHDLWGVERWAQGQTEVTLSRSSLAVIREGVLGELPLHSSKEDLSELLA